MNDKAYENGSAVPKRDSSDNQTHATTVHPPVIPTTESRIELTPDVRKQLIHAPFFIPIPAATRLLRLMEQQCLDYPRKHRMKCMMILGEASSGKSKILHEFYNLHPRYTNKIDFRDRQPIVRFDLRSPNIKSFYDQGLKAMGIPPVSSHTPQQKANHFMAACERLEVKVLVMDEFHNGADGTRLEQDRILTTVRTITNELGIPLIVAGLPKLKSFVYCDPQLSSRFYTCETIPIWKESKEYRQFLYELEKRCGLRKPSNLGASGALAEKIRNMTAGITGEIVVLIETAAEWAIDNGDEQITVPLLDKLIDEKAWINPRERRDVL